MKAKSKNNFAVAVIGGSLIALILILGTLLMGQLARKDTEDAVNSVSLLYLDELAGRREQVVSSTLERNIENIRTAVSMLEEDDLKDISSLQNYQARMKKIYTLEKFAFVDSSGLIYTSLGTQDNISDYDFDYKALSEPSITVKDSDGKTVIIAIPVKNVSLGDIKLTVCFMEIDMATMLKGVSLQSDNNGTTFCNIYTKKGSALTDMILGGLASEDNLLDALDRAVFENSSADRVRQDFEEGRDNVVTFTYDNVRETLSYKQIEGTDWMLTYLIRQSVISSKISNVSRNIILRSLIQTAITMAVLLLLFAVMLVLNRKNIRLAIEKETAETENRVKQAELEERLALQEKLIKEEKLRSQQDQMITAMASDYKSVYYADLDSDTCICYRSEVRNSPAPSVGESFSFTEGFGRYANDRVAPGYREGFLNFVKPENIRERLKNELLLTYRYLTVYEGRESYEMLRIAGVRHPEDRKDGLIHAIGVGFTDIDTEMREAMVQKQALSDALTAAQEASKAKTFFLSNMSHEIRTPMNAIIGLDNIALSDPDISDETRDYLEKIGDSANHLLGIINDILDMSRIESGRMVLKSEEFSFSKLLSQVNTIFSGQCSENELKYSCTIEGSVSEYYIGDNTKLRQVLVNILGNAVKFTPKGGSVSFAVRKMADFGGRETLCFTISDTGIGISEDFMPHLFDTFAQEDSSATNKYGSSGLGLAITKNIVEMMNGSIDVKSEKNRGTEFSVTVTLKQSEHKNIKDTEILPQEVSVLVVDDDEVAGKHAKLVLENSGLHCDIVLSGREAIERVKLHHARNTPYDLILVDLKMPEMDGIETTKRLRDIVGRESAIIIITAYKWDDVLEEAGRAGVDSFIAKPVFAEAVLEEFSSALQKRQSLPRAKKTELEGLNILLAEDVDINAEIMKMILSKRGMITDRARNGKEAVELYKNSREGHYAAILMDIRMPEMNGLDACTAIRGMEREDAKTIPVIALTANAFDEDVQRSLQAGMNAHLAKPVEPELLYETLENLAAEKYSTSDESEVKP